MSRYKTPYVAGERNEEFWREVLVNRTIRDILFGPDDRLETLILDDGQKIQVMKNEKGVAVLGIED